MPVVCQFNVGDIVRLNIPINGYKGYCIIREIGRHQTGGYLLLMNRVDSCDRISYQTNETYLGLSHQVTKVDIYRPLYKGVYAFLCQEYVKIGKANDILSRLDTLQVGCPYEIRFWGVAKSGSEGSHHKRLINYRERGEWFRLNEPMSRYLIDNFLYYNGERLVDLKNKHTGVLYEPYPSHH